MRILAPAEAGFVCVAATSVARATSIWTFKASSESWLGYEKLGCEQLDSKQLDSKQLNDEQTV